MTVTDAAPLRFPTVFRAGPRELRRTPENWVDEPYGRIVLEPMSPTIGAVVRGVSMAEPVDPELFGELNRALLEWKVLFFRDQRLTSEQHRDFAAHWGELESHPFARLRTKDQP